MFYTHEDLPRNLRGFLTENRQVVNLAKIPDLNNNIRRCGNTTRQVDFAIQALFLGHIVHVIDHNNIGNNPNIIRDRNKLYLNIRLMEIIRKRLFIEHDNHLPKNMILQVNKPDFIMFYIGI